MKKKNISSELILKFRLNKINKLIKKFKKN